MAVMYHFTVPILTARLQFENLWWNLLDKASTYQTCIHMVKDKKGLLPFQYISLFNPLPDDKILDWSKLKQIADDILQCIQNEK